MVIDPFRFGAQAATATWSPLSKYLSLPSGLSVLSNGNTELSANTSATGTYANAVSSREIQNLGYYSGVVETNSGDTVGFGPGAVLRSITSADFPQDNFEYVGLASFSAGLWANSGSVYRQGQSTLTGTGGLSFGVEVAIRLVPNFGGSPTQTQMRAWIRRSGGSWYGGGDPVADTTPTHTATISVNTNYIALLGTVTRSGATSARKVTLHGDAASTTGTPPTGFTKALWGDELT